MLRRTRVVTRLVVRFLVVSLCMVAIWLAAIASARETRGTAGHLSAAQAQLFAAEQLKFRITDVGVAGGVRVRHRARRARRHRRHG
ncbi:hypothetical protein [Dactylosporangium sp. NPDC048998]|uniref:hypothetical protein n=1 Tax=Dactylosporangium sp. NPDC048998 TaxID=3363976 RepID=UPI00371848A7